MQQPVPITASRPLLCQQRWRSGETYPATAQGQVEERAETTGLLLGQGLIGPAYSQASSPVANARNIRQDSAHQTSYRLVAVAGMRLLVSEAL